MRDPKLEEIEGRYRELERRLGDPELFSQPQEMARVAREHARVGDILALARECQALERDLEAARGMLASPSLGTEERRWVEEEAERIEALWEEKRRELRRRLSEGGPEPGSVILEIRAGTGGEEAALFAADLLRMYLRYAERKGWRAEILDTHPTELGGYKEAIVSLSGEGCFRRLRYEGGVHRVQRIPVTESGGRIHTSTATVAVLPEPDEVEVDLRPEELRVETFRAGGHGGQHVNKTESAVRITHLPTGLSASCQDERSQHKNREKALKILRARVYEHLRRQREEEIGMERREQVGTGERAEKIRTYNFPQNRVTDHRAGITLYRLEDILEGDLDELLDAVGERVLAGAGG
jgi:peptide chain release factor 1